MKTRLLCVALLALLFLPSCATTHSIRWAYGKTSTFTEPTHQFSSDVLKPMIGVPVVVTAVGWDVVTFPFQAIFGVWPFWGDASLHMVPGEESGEL